MDVMKKCSDRIVQLAFETGLLNEEHLFDGRHVIGVDAHVSEANDRCERSKYLTMLDRVAQRFRLKPSTLGADR